MDSIQKLILEYSKGESGYWLNCFDWQKIPVEPMKICVEGKVTAMYCAMTDELKIAGDRSDDVYFGSVIHELYHAYQRHTTGLVKYLLMKTLRRKKLEAPAKQAELDATEWLGDQRIKQWKEKHENEHCNT